MIILYALILYLTINTMSDPGIIFWILWSLGFAIHLFLFLNNFGEAYAKRKDNK